MCFYNDDYDWYADVQDESHVRCEKATGCDECGSKIQVGQWKRHIYQQEEEMCRYCEDEDSIEYEKGFDCKGDCDFGETSEYDCCVPCMKILAAIYEQEKDEDCPEHSRRPSLGLMWEEAFDSGHDDQYVSRILEMFPEVSSHRFVQQTAERRMERV